MWPFKASKHGQSPAQLRTEVKTLRTAVEALTERCTAAEQGDAERTEERDFFHAAWLEVGQRAMDAETVVECLEKEVSDLRSKVADLEAIAGPHVPADEAPEPIYEALRSSETTQEIPVKTLAGVVLAGAR